MTSEKLDLKLKRDSTMLAVVPSSIILAAYVSAIDAEVKGKETFGT